MKHLIQLTFLLLVLTSISSRKFVFLFKQNLKDMKKLTDIARNAGAGCEITVDDVDCVFPTPATLDNVVNQFKALGVEFEQVDQFGAVNAIYYAFSSEEKGYKNIKLRLCITGLYDFYLNKIDNKITLLDDICFDDPQDCVKKENACDDADCLSVPKQVFKSALNLTLLNQYQQLYPTAAIKNNRTPIQNAFEQFKTVLQKDSLNSKCASLKPDKCMALIVEKGTPAKGDTIKVINQAMIDGLLNGC